MSCFQVSIQIAKQLYLWVSAITSALEQVCSTITQQLQQWQQQWQNSCTTTTSQVCNSLPWPLSALCSWVTTVVCTLVSILVLIVTTVVQTVCTLVTIVISVILLFIVTVLSVVFFILCIISPCSTPPMESSKVADGGWLITLGGPDTPELSQNNSVEALPDGQLACQSMLDAIGGAGQRIHLLELEFSPDFEAAFSTGAGPTILAQALLAANRNGVAVRILLNSNAFADSVSKLQTFFVNAGGPPNTVEVRGLNVFPEVLHAKALIVDGAVAFSIGLPFDQGYWDTQEHLVTDSRRGTGAGGNVPGFGDVGDGVGNKPAHTVSLRIAGPAAANVDATFINLWNSVSGVDTVPPPVPIRGDGHQTVQIARTAPQLKAAGLTQGEKGILEAHLRAINNARTFIYLEEQYLTSPVINAALVAALKSNPSLQLIMLANENPDLPTYKFWQNLFLGPLGDFSGQVGVFSPWRTKATAGQRNEIMQCYVESKVAIVDDVWAAVGSGNLDGASLGHIFEFIPKPLSCFSGGWRNIELDAVLYDDIAGQPATGEVARLRRILWREHLGAEVNLESAPSGGWLALWREIAGRNVAALNTMQTLSDDSRILPYAPALDTQAQLQELGVNVSLLNVAPAVPT